MVDNVEIIVRAGKGGNGAATFHREKYIPRGGPDGGDGGPGGSVSIEADRNMDDLGCFKGRGLFRAGNGQSGARNKKSGGRGEELVIKVPLNTLVWDLTGGEDVLLADLTQHGEGVTVAGGGKGGRGNVHFATSTNQAPTEAEEGTPGQERRLRFEMRLAADIALVGPPNSGRSSLLRSVSRAPVAVAEYPFTTRGPELGAVDLHGKSVVVVDLPGLMPGSHAGKGLGNSFLRHAQRSGALVYVIAGDAGDPIADYLMLREELGLYDKGLLRKPHVVAVNKADLPSVQAVMEELRKAFHRRQVEPHFISAQTGQGVMEVLAESMAGAKAAVVEAAGVEEEPVEVIRPKPKARKG